MRVQRADVKGNLLDGTKEVNEAIEVVFHGKSLPKGLVGYDLENNLAEVVTNKDGKTIKMKMGKYLKKQGYADQEAAEISGLFKDFSRGELGELRFTESADEVEEVYKEGPNSCMSGEEAVRAYCTEDVCIAYYKVGESILARTVVCKNPDIGLQYTTVYGNCKVLVSKLEELGYVKGDLSGCKLDRIENCSGLVLCPYLDTIGKVSDKGDHLLVCHHGEYIASNTSGYLGEMCSCCGEAAPEDSMYWSEYYNKSMCEVCFLDSHTRIGGECYAKESGEVVYSEYHQEYLLYEDSIYIEYIDDYVEHDSTCWSEYRNECILSDDAIWCEQDNDHVLKEDSIKAVVDVDGFEDIEEGNCIEDNCKYHKLSQRWVHEYVWEDYCEHHDIQYELDLEVV